MGVVASRVDDRILEPHSPELALVDPELRALALSLLAPTTPDSLLVSARSRPPDLLESIEPCTGPLVLARRLLASEGPMFRVALTFATLLAAFLGVLAGMGGHPSTAAVSSAAPTQVEPEPTASATTGKSEPLVPRVLPAPALRPAVNSAQRPRSSSKAPAASSPAQTAVRRFAWAEDATASAYRFELFRGQTLILRRETRAPYLQVPATWRSFGKTFMLAPGKYRWYVWPILDGRPSARAIVQAVLEIQG